MTKTSCYCVFQQQKTTIARRFFHIKPKRVVVAMSGGVDSSVAAALLVQAGHEVIGVHMQNWNVNEETGSKGSSVMCPNERDWRDVQAVGSHLAIPVHRVSFEQSYWTEVFEPTVTDYASGFTPNPDTLCNREIKF
eukprot:CAMPEP_0206401896 /NCGR_PEP_ID=MMETSP0294-20121207/26582_1 /ASSEMBLY_ACC=CAM_ASM_000327 /TAXON_ID=39354 /ORGANISM="Heterosigma akashiwo, Strain CCMP2393" /LENGTH=135 /DNA_ID=CAMNT_0053858763 /DNA_START=18 /DNA_END=422 /DNA_ORIENTATION=+